MNENIVRYFAVLSSKLIMVEISHRNIFEICILAIFIYGNNRCLSLLNTMGVQYKKAFTYMASSHRFKCHYRKE